MALIAAAVTSSRIPISSSQLSKLDPMLGLFFFIEDFFPSSAAALSGLSGGEIRGCHLQLDSDVAR
jgi:hypothetical protein